MMVNRAECDCGNTVDYITKDKPLRCFHCGDEMEFVGKVGCVTGVGSEAVPTEDLEALVEEWRTYSGFLQQEDAKKQCARELQELIDDE